MPALARKHDESRPGPRFLVLTALFFSGRDMGLLSIAELHGSPVSMAYAVALATAVIATLVTLRRRAGSDTSREAGTPQTGPVRHESTLFTDPWYQVPTIFCVFILASRFVLDLVAEPPTTDQARWFLAGLGIVALAVAFSVTGAADSTKRPKDEQANPAGEAAMSGEGGSAVGEALRDPWFSVIAASLALLHMAQDGLETIEEDPESPLATVWLFLPPAALLLISLASSAAARTRRTRQEATPVVEAGAAPAPEEAASTPADQ